MAYGFRKSLVCVLGILTQATVFLILAAYGITALISTVPATFGVFQWLGAAFLIYCASGKNVDCRAVNAHVIEGQYDVRVRIDVRVIRKGEGESQCESEGTHLQEWDDGSG